MTKYTAVFDWPDGEEPRIKKSDAWLGGTLCSVTFYDAISDYNALKKAAIEVVVEHSDSASQSIIDMEKLLEGEEE